MRAFFLHSMLLALLPATIYSQNSVSDPKPLSKSSQTILWDLDKYLWSHTHYKTGENDKPAIDFDAIDNWPSLGENGSVSISPDGKYFAYTVIRGGSIPSYFRKKQDSLIIQSTDNTWRLAFENAKPGFFSRDSKQYIFQDKETLCLLKAGSSEPQKLKGVASYKVQGNGKNEWLAYQLKDSNATVALKNLLTGNEYTFTRVSSYNFDNSSTWLICQSSNATKDLQLYNLKTGKELHFSSVGFYSIEKEGKSLVIKNEEGGLSYNDLTTAKTVNIWKPAQSTEKVKDIKMDGRRSQVAFIVEDNNKMNSIWYWKQGMDKAVLKVNSETKGLGQNLLLQPFLSFTDNDNYIRFALQPQPDIRKPMEDAVQVDVWSYQDTVLQSTQPSLEKQPKTYSAIFSVEGDRLIYQEKDNEKLYLLKGDFAVVQKPNSAIYGDCFWEKDYDKDSNWLVSLKDGRRRLLPTREGENTLFFSPDGNYLVYFDGEKGCHYFSYDLYSNVEKDICSNVPSGQLGHVDSYLRTEEKPKSIIGPAAWIEGKEELLVYDNYDIWQLDLTGKKPALNLTNGYGALHKTVLSMINHDRKDFSMFVIDPKATLLLKAFNRHNKYNGFFKKSLTALGDPDLLYMGSCFFTGLKDVTGLSTDNEGITPLKATNTSTWIVQKQSATDAPNYFLTHDFKKFIRLTNLQPQKKYNWLTAELVSFPQLDSILSQAIMYKPENFDSKEKYPVIISFYAQLSDRLYQYLRPAYIEAPHLFDNPAWMISHGYIVIVPDIYFTKGQWGPSTVNAMEGLAKYLKSLPYVDSAHIGVTGHSNSGRFGYYLLTHSHSFAAMAIGAGTTNIISSGLSFDKSSGTSFLEWTERTAFGAGGLGNLWENKEKWIDHTSVLNVDKVVSPLLLFHNKNDVVDVNLAAQIFIALRRLEKPVWWLQYDNGDHVLSNPLDLRDFTIRYTQYFDHYLKGAPMPYWMKKGISYRLKGIETGYELKNY